MWPPWTPDARMSQIPFRCVSAGRPVALRTLHSPARAQKPRPQVRRPGPHPAAPGGPAPGPNRPPRASGRLSPRHGIRTGVCSLTQDKGPARGFHSAPARGALAGPRTPSWALGTGSCCSPGLVGPAPEGATRAATPTGANGALRPPELGSAQIIAGRRLLLAPPPAPLLAVVPPLFSPGSPLLSLRAGGPLSPPLVSLPQGPVLGALHCAPYLVAAAVKTRLQLQSP